MRPPSKPQRKTTPFSLTNRDRREVLLSAFLDELSDESYGIRLGFGIRSAVKEFGDPPWADRIEVKEIGGQVMQCLCGAGVLQERTQLRYHVGYPPPVVSQQVEEVVGILIVTSRPEGKCLESYERARSADANVSSGGLFKDGLASQGQDVVVLECQMQTWSDNCRPIVRERKQAAGFCVRVFRFDQEIHRYGRLADAPSLTGGFACLISDFLSSTRHG